MLLYILPLRLHVPYHDSWAFVKQYQDWMEGRYGWREFFASHNDHPSAPGKLIYFAIMHLCGGDLGLLPLVTWVLTLVGSLAVLGLSRPLQAYTLDLEKRKVRRIKGIARLGPPVQQPGA